MGPSSFIHDYPADVTVYLDSVRDLFRKLLDRGLMVLRALPGVAAINEHTSAILLLYRAAMALVDALAELSGLPSIEAFRIVIRSFFETKCYVEYILKSDTLERAVAYQTQHIMTRIRDYEKYDGSTSAGQAFRANLKKDRLFGSTGLSPVDTKPAIRNLEGQLSREPYKTAHTKLTVMKKPNWYAIDNGPADFRRLCDHLNYQMAYDFLYRQLSMSVHATGAYVDSFFSDHGEGRMYALRALAGYQGFANIGLSLVVDFIWQTTSKLSPHEHERFARFYKNIYKPFRDGNVSNVTIET